MKQAKFLGLPALALALLAFAGLAPATASDGADASLAELEAALFVPSVEAAPLEGCDEAAKEATAALGNPEVTPQLTYEGGSSDTF